MKNVTLVSRVLGLGLGTQVLGLGLGLEAQVLVNITGLATVRYSYRQGICPSVMRCTAAALVQNDAS